MVVYEPTTRSIDPDAAGLIAAVLASGAKASDVRRILEAADALRVDPLDYCCHRLGLSVDIVLKRAARWAGMDFCPTLPPFQPGSAMIQRVDALVSVRSLRIAIDGRDMFYFTPRFEEVLKFRTRVREKPEIARDFHFVPASTIRSAMATACAPLLIDEARQLLARRWPYACADLDLPSGLRIALFGSFVAGVTAAAAAPFFLREVLVPLAGLVLTGPALLRFFAAWQQTDDRPPVPLLADADLPIYSILIPLRDEATMVPLLRRAMVDLDYPPEKLEIIFVVESRSTDTVAAVRALPDDARFGLIVVPDAPPSTKPKALNFALPLVKGTHVVVYDAEDIPDPNQLRLAASHFAADPQIECLQAELVIDNAPENALTALFAGEYAGQFGLLLPLLGRLGLPMPLGGTSNHFRTATLRELGNWDSFNVTEDADLGVRLSRARRRTMTLASRTLEEAPITLRAWMTQRTRWMKGWMQTFIVHNRRPRQLLADLGWRNFLFFEIFVSSMILSSLLHTLFLLIVIARLILGAPFTLRDGWDWACVAILIAGYGGSFSLTTAALIQRRQWGLLGYQMLLPFYWVLHSLATLRAAYQLMTRPYFWGKTEHGRTRLRRTFRGS